MTIKTPGRLDKVNWREGWAMKCIPLQLLLAFLSLSAALRAAEFHVASNTVVVLGGVEAGRKALGMEDDFIRTLSDFDRAARVKAEQPVSREQFLKFIEGEAMAWSDTDAARIEKAAAGVREKLSKFKVMLPQRILLVQTTGREEAQTAYCRGTNIIVLARRFVNGPSGELESALIHELFHLLTRNNPDLRARLYALIGFKPCGEIQFPVELDSRRITNPDAPRLDFSIEVTYQEQQLAVVPVLFATPERWTREKGGEFLNYLTWRLMAVERVNGIGALCEQAESLYCSAHVRRQGFVNRLENNPARCCRPKRFWRSISSR
jgi:hypothetical protein